MLVSREILFCRWGGGGGGGEAYVGFERNLVNFAKHLGGGGLEG